MFFGKKFSGYHKKSLSGLDILVLSIITNGNGVTGYDLIQDINEKFKDLWQASAGTIYPLLNRLSVNLLVETQELIDVNNRQKKIYRISEKGKEELKRVLESNLEPSINSLGDFIRTIFKASMPSEETMVRMIGHFPFPEFQFEEEIKVSDYTKPNIKRLKRLISHLEHGKRRLEAKTEEMDKKIQKYKNILKKIEIEREEILKSQRIDISDNEDEFNNL